MRMRHLVAVAMLIGAAPAYSAPKAGPDGKAFFAANCVACHGADGRGVPGSFPSLRGSLRQFFASKPGRAYLSQILLTGLSGKIQSGGQSYFGAMPSFESFSDAELALVLNYLRVNLNGPASNGSALTVSQIASARRALAGSPSTKSLREAALKAVK